MKEKKQIAKEYATFSNTSLLKLRGYMKKAIDFHREQVDELPENCTGAGVTFDDVLVIHCSKDNIGIALCQPNPPRHLLVCGGTVDGSCEDLHLRDLSLTVIAKEDLAGLDSPLDAVQELREALDQFDWE